VVFNTTDKETGIDQYQIMEEPLSQYGSSQWGRADAPWVEAKSPHVLKDQGLNSIIRVRALDKAGNEYIASLMPDESLRSSTGFNLVTVLIIAISIIFVCLIFLIAYTLFKRTRNKRSQDSDDSGEVVDDEIIDDDEVLSEEEEEN
jgi:hypothetical protein